MTSYTLDELICVCIARQVYDGDIWAQGINTPLVTAGLLLAKATHAPHVRFASAIGQGICDEGGAMGLSRIEDLWLGKGLIHVGFAVATADLLPSYTPKEFFRPAQVDMLGNFNNIAFGQDPNRPRLRLPGSGGIPDVTTHYDGVVYLYVPRHGKIVFAEKLDYISGLGHVPHRRRGSGPVYLVSDLGQFDWANGRMRVTHLHPGVTMETLQKKTGFALERAPSLGITDPPTPEEITLLREVIDPLGIRKLELLAGNARKDLLRDILMREQTLN